MNFKKVFLSIVFMASFGWVHAGGSYVLCIPLWNMSDSTRVADVLDAFEKNKANLHIKTIVVVYDYSSDSKKETNRIRQFIEASGAPVYYIHGHPTFGQCAYVLNKNYPNENVMIASPDLYFKDLSNLNGVDLTGRCVALTRWVVEKNGAVKLHDNEYSQDCWIFKTVNWPMEGNSTRFGSWGYDAQICLAFEKAGLKVVNGCKLIQALCPASSSVFHYDTQRYDLPYGYQVPPQVDSFDNTQEPEKKN